MRPAQTMQLMLTNKKGDAVHIERFGYKKKDDMRERFNSAVVAYVGNAQSWLELLQDPAFIEHLEVFDFTTIVYANQYLNGNNVFDDVWYQRADTKVGSPSLPAIAM